MKFDWRRFCDERNIFYVTDGPNTAKGNISIKCPFCGQADDSQHMGLSLNINRPSYGCWRNQRHRGHKPQTLIAAILGISVAAAGTIIDNQFNNPDAFEAALENLTKQEEGEPDKKGVDTVYFPQAFRKFGSGLSAEKPFIRYLRDERGFGDQWEWLVSRYDLRWSVFGAYSGRIIVPVFYKGQLVTWTSRAIGKALIRYKSLQALLSVRNIKDCVLLPPAYLRVPRSLLIVSEGPFDTLKLQTFGHHLGITAVCVFGLTLSSQQLELLGRLKKMHEKTVVLLDSGESAASATIADSISEIFGGRVGVGKLPAGVKDAGELTPSQVEELVNKMLRNK